MKRAIPLEQLKYTTKLTKKQQFCMLNVYV